MEPLGAECPPAHRRGLLVPELLQKGVAENRRLIWGSRSQIAALTSVLCYLWPRDPNSGPRNSSCSSSDRFDISDITFVLRLISAWWKCAGCLGPLGEKRRVILAPRSWAQDWLSCFMPGSWLLGVILQHHGAPGVFLQVQALYCHCAAGKYKIKTL